jgi:hypothetical protein
VFDDSSVSEIEPQDNQIERGPERLAEVVPAGHRRYDRQPFRRISG